MSVIITGIDIPKSCVNCPVCHCKGKDDPWNYVCFATMDDINIEEWDRERYITCPLKTMEELIEKIRNKAITHSQVVEGEYFAEDAEYINYGLNMAIDLIKEYCEVTE